jgi:hypothetical protein
MKVIVDDLELAIRTARFLAFTMRAHTGGSPPLGNVVQHVDTPSRVATTIIYSRDSNMHSSGWFKNPDYERCLHLSLSFHYVQQSGKLTSIPFDRTLARAVVERIFDRHTRLIWTESPKSEGGRLLDVWHYRVFCDEHWRPIMPRGEVYGRELTEAGWKSWSELHDDQPAGGSSTTAALENPERG